MKVKKTSIPLSIWVIGIASGLLNVTSSLIFSLSGMFLNSRGVTIDWISTLEHTVEALAMFMKVLSGIVSDFFRRRKTIILIGFGLSMLSRPILALGVTFFVSTTAFIVMFISRILERIANGLQSTPRDALVADLSPVDMKGECFGLRQTLTTAGSFIGSGLAMLFMYITQNNYEKIFWFALIPPVIAFLILYIFVHDVKPVETDVLSNLQKLHKQEFNLRKNAIYLGHKFWWLMCVVLVFMLARVSESILSLHALKTHGLPETLVPIVGVIYNSATCFSAYPIGRLSDRMSRSHVLLVGFLCLLVADLLLSLAPNIWVVLIGVAAWGVQIGVTQSMFLALIVDFVPQELRGTGFGVFYFFSAASIFIAGLYGGYVSKNYSISVMYLCSGLMGVLSIASLLFIDKFIFKKKA